jgi:hypothetical protein
MSDGYNEHEYHDDYADRDAEHHGDYYHHDRYAEDDSNKLALGVMAVLFLAIVSLGMDIVLKAK